MTTSDAREKAEQVTTELVDSINALHYDGSKRPVSDGLRSAWPGMGRAWIAEWARELGRDLLTVASDLNVAAAATGEDDALTPLENARSRV